MSIGQRISHLRKQNAMTQEELADVLGTTRQAISKWESGKSLPDIDYAIKIGSYFDVSMDYLLLGKMNLNNEQHVMEKVPLSQEPKIPFFYILISLVGCFILLLLPLMLRIYRNYIFAWEGVAYTNPNNYLTEWPFIGITIFGFLLFVIGLGGIVRNKWAKKSSL